LELTSQVRRRAALLCAQGFDMDLRVGIHTGMVRILPGQLPTGLTPNTAMQLAQQAQSGEVLASATSRKILAQYVEFSDAGKHIQTNDGESLPYFAIQGEFKAETLFLMRRGKMSQGMVGREEEFVQLQKTWQQVCSGQGCAVLLQGEAGIGKSRLSYEICTHVRQQAASVLEVRCLPEYQNNALQPILTLLKKHLSLQDAIPQEAVARLQTALLQAQVKLEWVLPILCSWLALPMPEQFPAMQFSPERQKSLLLDALQSLIFQFAHGQHLLFLVEDMHWIDQTSQELLDRMLKALGQQAVLLLMSARPGFVNPWPTLVEVVQLGRLSEAAAGQLVNTMLGGQAIDATDLARLCQRTDGVPLFLEELTRMLLDSQLLVERSGVYQLDARFDTSDIPVTLRDLLSARLARLGPAIDTAQLAAAIGREFDYALLLEVALTDEATLQTHLEQLITADLVHRQRRVTGDSYIFRHALIRDAAYDTMPKKIREQTHSRIGRQMARAEPAEIERNLATLAQHFAHALEFEPAVDYGTRAAQIFLKRALTIDALKQCEMVQHWTSTLGELVRRPAEIRINRILTSAYLFRFGLGDERVKRQADHELILMDGCDNVQMVFPSMWWLAYYHHLAGHREIVRALVGKLFELTSQSDDKGLLAASNVLHGFALWNEGDCVQAEAALSQAVQDYDPIAHADHCERFGRDTGIFAMSILSVVKRFTDLNDAVAFDMCEAAVARARERNHILTLGIALVFQAQIYHFVDDRDKALAVTTELLALTRQYSVPQLEIYGSILYAWATTNLSLAQKVLDVLCGLGGALGVPYYSSLVAEIEARAGDHVAAFERIQACLALATQVGEGYYKPELLIKSAEYRAKTSFSDPQQSRNDLQQAIAFAKTSGMRRCVQRASERLDFYS
jgi:TOMM system kinase/cyclase fusion protein